MAKSRTTIGANPLDAVVPQQPPRAEPPQAAASPKKAMTVRLPTDLMERLQAAVYWSPGQTVTAVLETALAKELDVMEEANGGPFKPPGGAIKTGRRAGT